MKNLQERVQRMVDGERKRREVALRFLQEVQEILEPAAPDIWGTGEGEPDCENYVTLTRLTEDGKKKKTGIYFRYRNHYGTNETEYPGFYDHSHYGYGCWGKPVEDMKGRDFWYCIQVIIEWLPQVAKQMEKKSAGREALLEKINIE